MKTPFPLFARLLLWFFGNLLLLIIALLIMIRLEFGSLDNLLLPQSSQNEIQAMCVDLVGNLAHSTRSQWSGELAGLSFAYRMNFALFDAHGNWITGAPIRLPDEVRHGLILAHSPRLPPPPSVIAQDEDAPPDPLDLDPLPGPPPPDGSLPGTPLREAFFPGPPPRSPGRIVPDFPKSVIRTHAAYWLLVRLPPDPLQLDGPVTLVGTTPSLGISPLLFNPMPWFAVGACVILFSILFWLPMARSITAPIGRMTRATESMAGGNFDVELASSRSDELGRLGHAINRMAVRLKEFVTGQKRFLGDAAHELCSPLARMEVGLGILEEQGDERLLPFVRDVREEVAHMRKLANELLSFSKASLGEQHIRREPVNLAEIVDSAVRLEKGAAAAIECLVPDDLFILGDFELLQRAIANLLRNALRYASGTGTIGIEARREGERILLVVSDQGPGVAAPEIERLFDPFYRIDASRTSETGGTGLGLAIVKSCVEACGGTVTAANRAPRGLEVRIRLLAA